MRWNPIDHMNAARANKPASGGKTYKRYTRKQSDLNAMYPDDNARFIYGIREGWRVEKQQIIQTWERAVYPERYEELT